MNKWKNELTFNLSLSFTPKANDSPSVSNDRELRYNRMELGDLNANFTLEVESRVNRLPGTGTVSLLRPFYPPANVFSFLLLMLAHLS